MGTPIDANGRSILHKGHGETHVSAVPDVCKTPSPGGPVPIPYPNFAMDSNLVDCAATVQIQGNPVAHVKSKISTSSGDEPGTAGGLMSSVNKGTCTWKMGSANVKAEGESVVRFLDTTYHNGNSFNTVFLGRGGLGMGYADDFDGLCPICDRAPLEHAVRSTENTAMLCAGLIRRLREACQANMDRPSSPNHSRDDVSKGKGKKRQGYMVGVMICRHALDQARSKSNTFAAMSGDTTDGFERIANEMGMTPIVGGRVTAGEMADANRSGASELNVLTNVTAAYMQVLAASMGTPNGTPRQPGYNPYGICAAAKLLARSRHGPIQMTEAWFQPPMAEPQPPFGPYQFRVNGVRMRNRTWDAGQVQVPSCNSCQRTLFMTMCPVRTCVPVN